MFDFDRLSGKTRYKLLTATVLPRPIAWVTTINREGRVNAAPFSFFNIFSEDPALVILGLQHHDDGSPKDTTRNIHQRGEFVVNLVNFDLLAPMVGSASAYPSDVSEVEALQLRVEPGVRICVTRIAAAPIALECRQHTRLTFSPRREILIGEVIAMHAQEGLIDPETFRINWNSNYPVGRLFADLYSTTQESRRHAIPPAPSRVNL
jgi:flavin reductase (DIM6/NTAB) family NADH-FMN oxidoreductase RutF